MSNWFDYDWTIEDQPAAFHVDLSFVEELDRLGDFTVLLTVTWTSLYPDADSFSTGELRQLNKALLGCKRLLDTKAVYVGFVDSKASRKLYFYTNDQRLLVPLMNYCADERSFRGDCTKAIEPNRQTYYRFLVPDQAKRQGVNNGLYIRAMVARGDDSSACRRINLHFAFPSGRSRILFCEDMLPEGFAIGQDAFVAEREQPYLLTVHVISPLLLSEITRLTTVAIRMAEGYGGKMEHLDADFVPKRKW